jgi:hypothetical protein
MIRLVVQGPVAKFFQGSATEQEKVDFVVLESTGHCPHDDNPEAVHRHLKPWLRKCFGQEQSSSTEARVHEAS